MRKVSNRCSVCQKQLGTSYCTGCGVYFCTKDFKNHRDSLFTEMDSLLVRRTDLHEKIAIAAQYQHVNSPLLAKIDQWQQMMIEKIIVVADHTRQQVADLLSSKRMRLEGDFARFSQELFELKQTENFVEHDLERLKYTMHQFHQELKQLTKPMTIVLHTELSDRLVWSRLIYAEEKSTYSRLQPRQLDAQGKNILRL